MLETLRNAGTESPSGRLVIDLNTLRQVHAAVASPLAVSEETRPLQAPAANQPAISRMNVPVERPVAKRSNLWIAGVIVLIAMLGSGILATRWWRGSNSTQFTQSTPTPTPTETPTP